MDGPVVVLHSPRRIEPPPQKRCKTVTTTMQTNLMLPTSSNCRKDPTACNVANGDSTKHAMKQTNLCLPLSSSTPLDKYLSSVPQVVEGAEKLLSSPLRHFSRKTTRERLLYVGQGELAHATQGQCDILVSDKATTCHILALRSTHVGSSKLPLASLAHIDWDGYEACIRRMVQEHKAHHYSYSNNNVEDEEEEKKQDDLSCEKIEMDIYIMGGFDDAGGSSRTISHFLVRLLARLADEETDSIQMTIKTSAISSMNGTGNGRPIGRGMGIDLRTGEAFLAKVDKDVAGPCPELRSARLWAGACDQLTVIHTSQSSDIVIQPFFFRPKRKFAKLLRLPNHKMIQRTSTSPTVEEDDFCDHVRGTFRFMLRVNCFDVFGIQCSTPLIFHRVQCTNEWVLACRSRHNEGYEFITR